ncbi:MAG TPA: helix-turn-helix transcriptional regulator [Candidatus Angelobacter sp.]|jgi:transcriptional regulator with XRE-family HTH domain
MGRPLKRKAETREQAIGAVITELRVKKGMTGQDVAEKVGCNDGHMYEIERGQQNPTYRFLQAIADLHGIKLSKLFALAEKKYAQNRR